MAAGKDKTSLASEANPGNDAAVAPEQPASVAAADPLTMKRAPARGRDGRQREGNVGHALRGVYQQTVNEDIPDEMLKLLGKLT